MKIDHFFAELKRRNVYKVAIAYIFAGWALSQGIAQVFPVFDVPNWVIRSIVVVIILELLHRAEAAQHLQGCGCVRGCWLTNSSDCNANISVHGLPNWVVRLIIVLIAIDPLLEPLHGDPRFEALVQKVVGEKK